MKVTDPLSKLFTTLHGTLIRKKEIKKSPQKSLLNKKEETFYEGFQICLCFSHNQVLSQVWVI